MDEISLKVIPAADKEAFYVVNMFDGVIVGEFYTQWDAEDFARSELLNEQNRIKNAYYLDFK